MTPTLHHQRMPAPGHPSRWMRGAVVAAVASAILLSVGPPAAYAVDGPPRQPVGVEAGATSVGRPVAPQPETAPPAPAIAAPVDAVDFVWLLPLAGGLAVLGAGWVLSRRNRHDDSDQASPGTDDSD